MQDFLNERVMPPMMRFINTKALRALKDGILFCMPMLIIGSIFLLLANFPFTPVADWFTRVGLKSMLDQAYGSTFNIMAMIVAVGIAYTYVKNAGHEGLSAGVISLACFLILQPSVITDATGAEVSVILKDWTAGKGMVCAIACGLIVGWVYTVFMDKHITIKMPEGVPVGVSNAFVALIPGAVLIAGASVIYAVFQFAAGSTFIEWIYQMLQKPLQGTADSVGGVVLIGLSIPFLWFFGVHGSSIIEGVLMPIMLSNAQENQAILDAGKALTLENGAHIVTAQFYEDFMVMCGAGITIGIVIYMVFFAKSTQLRSIGKLGIGPALFNINEPVLFGTPVVLNPLLIVPFMLTPLVVGLLEYVLIYMGVLPFYAGVYVPWTTPPVISGFLVGDWRTALFQLAIIAISVAFYLPFIKKVDRMAYQRETEAQGL